MARVIISIPDELLEELDTYARENTYNRSELVRHAIRHLLRGAAYVQKDTYESVQAEEDN